MRTQGIRGRLRADKRFRRGHEQRLRRPIPPFGLGTTCTLKLARCQTSRVPPVRPFSTTPNRAPSGDWISAACMSAETPHESPRYGMGGSPLTPFAQDPLVAPNGWRGWFPPSVLTGSFPFRKDSSRHAHFREPCARIPTAPRFPLSEGI